MKKYRIENMKGGWFVGDFEPTALRTNTAEVCYKEHKKGEHWDKHYHKQGIEVTYVISGKMRINLSIHHLMGGAKDVEVHIFGPGDIFTIYPGEIVYPEFLEDCSVIVFKTPSVPGDKYVVEE